MEKVVSIIVMIYIFGTTWQLYIGFETFSFWLNIITRSSEPVALAEQTLGNTYPQIHWVFTLFGPLLIEPKGNCSVIVLINHKHNQNKTHEGGTFSTIQCVTHLGDHDSFTSAHWSLLVYWNMCNTFFMQASKSVKPPTFEHSSFTSETRQ